MIKLTMLAAIMTVWIIIWLAFMFFYNIGKMFDEGLGVDDAFLVYIPYAILLSWMSREAYVLASI